jgi:crotonobetainyl-CoA:carnitine CoA-transferase CaiB-like acyl-CoA transferase
VARVARVAEVDAQVQAWVGTRSVAECVARLGAASIACGPITPIQSFPREANLEYRGMVHRVARPDGDGLICVPGSPFRMTLTPGRPPGRLPRPDADRRAVCALASQPRTAGDGARRHPAPELPLAGLRVIEIGHYTTVPLAAKHFASLGADVIKIEPPEGEATRDLPPHKQGQGYFFTATNSDKRSLALDLASATGIEALRRLIKSADVLIENLKPGTLARRGFPAAEIERLNPRIVYCAVSGFGADSIYKGRPAVDTVIQAMSGLMDAIRSDGTPVKSGISTADLMGAQMAVLAVLAALEYRDRTGRGQSIDLSMQDITAWATQAAWNNAGALLPPAMLAAADGYVLVDADPDALERALRADRSDAATRSAMTREALAARLALAGLAAAPVLTVRESAALDQVRERRLWFPAPDEAGELWPLMASPLRLLGTPPAVRRPMARLGSDGPAILSALGMGTGCDGGAPVAD